MINKLRRRIILINMALIGVVILGIFTTVNINNYSNSVHTMERGLSQLLDKNDRFPMEGAIPPEEMDGFNQEGKGFRFKKDGMRDEAPMQITSYITVTVDNNGSILDKQESNVTMDDEALADCIRLATEKSGQIGDYSLMYVTREGMSEKQIAFADNSSIYSSLQNSLLISLALFIVSLGVIFGISLFLSNLAVKPVKKAWDQQKQFVADASHELKTPLTVILANNNIMMSHTESSVKDERQWLESTQEEANHMKQLIDEMLFLAKSDAGTEKIQLSDVDFSEQVEGCTLNFEPVAFEKEVLIDADIDEKVILHGNSTQLNQLVHILVDNAVKYADKGTVITVKLKRQGDYVHFSVNNHGNEMTPEDMEHIFDRFYRAEKSRTTKGYGLGLSIAQRIVQSMNGKLRVESDKENGTTFTAEFKTA